MKKILVFATLSLLLLASSALAQTTQLVDIFNAVAGVESAVASGDREVARLKADEVSAMMGEIDPAVEQDIGLHAVKAIGGFIAQLQKALQAEDFSAAEGPIASLNKIKSWVPTQYLTGI